MSHSNGFDRFQNHLASVEEMLGIKLPNFKPGQFEKILQDPGWVEKYVQDVLKKAMPSADIFSAPEQQQYNENIFETQRSVIVRVNIPKETNPKDIRIYLGLDHVRLEGLPSSRSKIIRLPSNVGIRGSRAKFKEGLLEIRMPKNETKTSETQIEIHYD